MGWSREEATKLENEVREIAEILKHPSGCGPADDAASVRALVEWIEAAIPRLLEHAADLGHREKEWKMQAMDSAFALAMVADDRDRWKKVARRMAAEARQWRNTFDGVSEHSFSYAAQLRVEHERLVAELTRDHWQATASKRASEVRKQRADLEQMESDRDHLTGELGSLRDRLTSELGRLRSRLDELG